MRTRGVRESREEHAHGVEEEWDAPSGRQGLREVHTVADRLAALRFQERQSDKYVRRPFSGFLLLNT